MDFERIILHTKVRVLKADGTVPAVDLTKTYALIANSLNGIWNKAVVSINNHKVYTCTNYSHTSFITSALMLPKEEHVRLIGTECYYLDEGPVNDRIMNVPWNTRAQLCLDGGTIEMMGVLRVPLFGTARCIPHGVRVNISLYSHAPAYFIHANHADVNYKLEVTFCQLHYQSMDMSDDFLREYQLLFDSGQRASLPFLDYKTFLMQLRTGARNGSSPQYTLNGYPRRVFVAFVKETNFQGAYNSTPYEFKSHSASLVKLKLGETELQQRTDRDKTNKSEILFHMYKALGWTGQNGVCHVTNENVNYNWIYVFDCTPTMNSSCLEFYSSTPKNSVFNVEVEFSAPLTDNVTTIIMAELDQVLAVAPDKEPVIFSPPIHD